MHEVLVNRLGGLSLPRKSVVRLTDRPDMILDVYRGRKQQCNNNAKIHFQGRTTFYTPVFRHTKQVHDVKMTSVRRGDVT